MERRSANFGTIRIRPATSRRGLSLLELIIASTMLTMLLGAVSMVLRTGRLAWEAHESDFVQIEAAQATLRHIVRAVRQAQEVVAVSGSADLSGNLQLRMPNGDVLVWDHDDATTAVNHGIGTADSLLADGISQLNIQAYEADGVTLAGSAATTQCLEIRVTVPLDRATGGSHTVSSWAWVRSW